MTQTIAQPTAAPPINRWGNTALAFGATGLLLSWIPWIGILGIALAIAGAGCATVGLFHSPRASAVAGIVLSVTAIAVPILIYG